MDFKAYLIALVLGFSLPDAFGSFKFALDCSNLDDGLYVNPMDRCGRHFFGCFFRNSFRFTCPKGHGFDQDATRCRPLHLVPGCGDSSPAAPQKPQQPQLPQKPQEPQKPQAPKVQAPKVQKPKRRPLYRRPVQTPPVQKPRPPVKRTPPVKKTPPVTRKPFYRPRRPVQKPQVPQEPKRPQVPQEPKKPQEPKRPQPPKRQVPQEPKKPAPRKPFYRPRRPVQKPQEPAKPQVPQQPKKPAPRKLYRPRSPVQKPQAPQEPQKPQKPQPKKPQVPQQPKRPAPRKYRPGPPPQRPQVPQEPKIPQPQVPQQPHFPAPSKGSKGGDDIITTARGVDCMMNADGNYPDGTQSCSNAFVSCVGGNAYVTQCSGMDGVAYDVDTDRCLDQNFVAACGGSPTPIPPPTSKTPVNKRPDGFDCSFNSDGDYPSHVESCSSVYYSCSGGAGQRRECALASSAFDEVSGWCLEREFVPACGGVSTTTVESVYDPAHFPDLGVSCGSLEDGIYADARSECSDWFVACGGGIATPLQCHAPLRFDVQTARCLEMDFVAACGGSPTPIPKIPEPTFRAPADIDCLDAHDGDYADPSDSCTARYFSCIGGVGLERGCPDDLVYDVSLGQCEESVFAVGCGGSPRPPTPKPVQREMPDLGVSCAGEVTGLFSDARYKCSRWFVSCNSGIPITMECFGNTRFDPVSEACLSPAHVADCGGVPTQPPPPQEGITLPPVDFNCGGKADGDYELSRCNNEYVSCSGGFARLMQCAEAFLVFDGAEGACEAAGNLGCGGGQKVQHPQVPQQPHRPAKKY